MGWFRRNEHDEEQLSAYLDGELNARQAENVERHLAACESCSALLEELRETRALLSALPAETPRRSFVLGAEYARTPVRDAAPRTRRWSMVLAPAVTLSVFVALLAVDLGNSSTSSSDESSESFTVATSRQTSGDDAVNSEAAGSAGGAVAEDTDASAGASSEPGPVESGTGPGTTPEGPPAAMSAELEPTPAEGESDLRADGSAAEESLPDSEPIALDAPEADDGGGISTLRILQVLAGAAFLASGLYVFVWPRLSRGGS